MTITEAQQLLLTHFCRTQQLPTGYQAMAIEYFLPLAQALAQASHNNHSGKPLIIGINGCQGSGKSTLAGLLEQLLNKYHKLSAANLSIDDFYHTKARRQGLASDIHPLFITRGVPGTHDIDLLQHTIAALSVPHSTESSIAIPRFDKARDDRLATELWDNIKPPVDIIILEGWCVGIQEVNNRLSSPVNKLEENEDSEGIWRNTIYTHVEQNYAPLFQQISTLIMLKAPHFDCVYQWRKKQEEKLEQRLGTQSSSAIMTTEALERFIQHYQRLTEDMLLSLPIVADIVFELNTRHQITRRLNRH